MALVVKVCEPEPWQSVVGPDGVVGADTFRFKVTEVVAVTVGQPPEAAIV